jgi:hypothetical protein
MAPAPRLGESELSAKIAEVYAMAMVREMSLEELSNPAAEQYRIDVASGDTSYFTLGPHPRTPPTGPARGPRSATVADLTAALGTMA